MALSRALRIALIVGAIAVALMCVGAATMPMFIPYEVLISSAVFGLLGLGIALVCAIVRDNGIMPRRMISGVIAALATTGVWLSLLFAEVTHQLPDLAAVPFLAGASWSGLMAITGLLALPKPRAQWWCMLRSISVVGLWTLAVVIVVNTFLMPDVSPFWSLLGFSSEYDAYDWLLRTIFGLALVVGGLVATTFLTLWLTPPVVDDAVRLAITLRCPRCDRQHSRQTGDDQCSNCGLRIRVLVA